MKRIKGYYDAGPKNETERLEAMQYVIVDQSVQVLLNFFGLASQQLSEDVVEKQMLLNAFAEPFLMMWEDIPTVNLVLNTTAAQDITSLTAFKMKWTGGLRGKEGAPAKRRRHFLDHLRMSATVGFPEAQVSRQRDGRLGTFRRLCWAAASHS
jgi:hypothetical protein